MLCCGLLLTFYPFVLALTLVDSSVSTPPTLPPHIVLSHPLVGQWLGQLRCKHSNTFQFKQALHWLGQALVMQATQNWPVSSWQIETPLVATIISGLSPQHPVWLVPILRAGLALEQPALALLPQAKVYHVGLYRDETTCQPVAYYQNLPNLSPNDTLANEVRVLLLDPMLATGGSAIAALQLLTQQGIVPENISFVSAIASPEGLQRVAEAFPTVALVCGAVDEGLNDKSYIVPGLGDAGDRYFNT
jgi:uracil phosphoribosyltransferase